MVSRRKILSRSRDDLTFDDDPPPFSARFEEDVWYSVQKLFTDHVEEILKKWDSIDDEIWAKAIVMERNRRVAKAYARAPVLTINGGEGGFDGFRLGLNGFSNPMRDPKTEEFKEAIGLGAKVKMDESGNILIKRLSKSPVYARNNLDDAAPGGDFLKLSNGIVDMDKPYRVFDMRKFQQNINRELRRTNPDRVRLESQCVISVCFVKHEDELLDSPVWVLLVNIVALEMLKAKLPQNSRVPFFQLQSKGEKRYPVSGSSDEDPYSLTSGHVSSGSSNTKDKSSDGLQGLLNKKEKDYFVPQNWSSTQDRRRDRSRDNFLDETESATLKPRSNNRRRILKKSDEKKKIVDDPYYCGFSARVPAYTETSTPAQTSASVTKDQRSHERPERSMDRPERSLDRPERSRMPKYREAGVLSPASQSAPNLAQIPQVQPYWWQSRLYPDQSRVFPDQGRLYPEQSRRYPEHLQGKGTGLGYNSGYFDNRLPYPYGNEFSSLQFTARVGLNPGGRVAPPTTAPTPPKPSTPASKPRRKFLSRHNMFKSSS